MPFVIQCDPDRYLALGSVFKDQPVIWLAIIYSTTWVERFLLFISYIWRYILGTDSLSDIGDVSDGADCRLRVKYPYMIEKTALLTSYKTETSIMPEPYWRPESHEARENSRSLPSSEP